MSLANLVQLVCNEGREARLDVASGGKTGEVYFGQGNVLHAAADGKVGEDAFKAVAGWTEGDFALEYEVASPEQTINRNWSSLWPDYRKKSSPPIQPYFAPEAREFMIVTFPVG